MQKQKIVALCVSTMSAISLAGPLSPPAGPVAPTAGPEPRIAINATNTPGDADSLFKITQPGSYYLTGNITGVAGKHGIEIAASGVTLDLNGFDLVGVPAMGSFDGVTATDSSFESIEVKNGSIRNWGDDGVDLGTSGSLNSAIVDLRASGNSGDGISAGTGCRLSRVSVYNNAVHGISLNSRSTIIECTAHDNGSSGIATLTSCTISGCTATSNGISGITGSFGSMIYGNSVRSNAADGIVVGASCFVLNNACHSNGQGGDGAGIRVTEGDNRIEGNNCIGADRGIDVDASGNVIIRNTCSNNGPNNSANWTIVANNVVGPILDRSAPASAAINGNSAPSSLGSTDPNANFTY